MTASEQRTVITGATVATDTAVLAADIVIAGGRIVGAKFHDVQNVQWVSPSPVVKHRLGIPWTHS